MKTKPIFGLAARSLVLLLALAWSAPAQTVTDANWVSLAPPASSGTTVLATAVDAAGVLYVGGQFTSFAGTAANHVARWDQGVWSPLGTGLAASGGVLPLVNALAVSGDFLYVGGNFLTAGGVEAWRLAKWDGNAWSPVGAERLNGAVHSLLADGSDLYVCGGFNNVAGLSGTGLLRWDGLSWHALGGLKGAVYALVKWNGELYAGGENLVVDGASLGNLVKWNGGTWSPVGDALNARVSALAVFANELYAGGRFTQAGTLGVNHIARWDGLAWARVRMPAGIGTDGFVNGLAAAAGGLFVGGTFGHAGGIDARYIARWDGTTWSSLGSGTDHSIYALTASGVSLFAGGLFDAAGGKPSGRVARVFPGRVPALEVPTHGGRAIIYFRDLEPGDHWIQRRTSFSAPDDWETLATRPADAAGGIDYVDGAAPPFQAFYQTVLVEAGGAP